MPTLPLHIAAPAKVNLYLGVHDETDGAGYHRVDSVMASLGICDEVVIEAAPQLCVACTPPVDVPQESNTCHLAVLAAAQAFGRSCDYRVTVVKNLPDRAGLGGSSSDAAAVIYGLCLLWGEDPQDSRAYAAARSVGADVPFFLSGCPTFLVERGDVVEEVLPPIEGVHLALAKRSDPGITAGEAYAEFDREPVRAGDVAATLEALRTGDARSLAAHLSNNLEAVAFRIMPDLRDLRDWMAALPGALTAMVTGSGSCVFAICETAADAEAIAEESLEQGLWAVSTTLVGHGPQLIGEEPSAHAASVVGGAWREVPGYAGEVVRRGEIC